MSRSLLTAVLLLAACNSSPTAGAPGGAPGGQAAAPQVRRLSPAEAKQLIDKGAAVVDVRERDEAADGMLAAAQVAPTTELRDEARFGQLAASLKGKPVVVYCAAGSRAQKIAERLARQGVEAHNGGGYSELAAAGLSTKKP